MRALVTGCAGFIGSHLCETLVAEGWHVQGIDGFTPYYDRADKLANLDDLRNEVRFELIEADIVGAPLQSYLVDRPIVFHLAAQPGVRASFADGFGRYVHDNVEATQQVLEAALEADVPRVVYASSSSVYGDAAAYPCGENTTPCRPRSPYGVTKRSCEYLADVYRNLGVDAVGLRYFTVYGPRQRPDMALRRLCEAALGGPRFCLYGDGLQSRDFTYVDDAVTATMLAGVTPDLESVLNIGGGHEATMREIIAIVDDLGSTPLSMDRSGQQRGDVRRTGADTTRARTSLYWTPTTRLTDGIRTEFDWVHERHCRFEVDQMDTHLASWKVS